MTAPKIFDPEYYERMRALEDASWWNAAMRDIAGGMLREARLPAEGVLLDVGCGSGQTMEWFRRLRPGWRTVGLDVAREGLLAARAMNHQNVLEASAVTLPLPDASVDGVITLDVLQHLPLGGGDLQALREMRRVLRPGGFLFVRTNHQTFPYSPDDPTYQFHKYTRDELREKLSSAGFSIVSMGRVNALLGLAEIPRDLRARKKSAGSYVGLLAGLPKRGGAWQAKRLWLRLEGSLALAGVPLPLGRTLLALVRAG
jgi:ubiquinone/menaquinone biosynthesis C-methylase UbiE